MRSFIHFASRQIFLSSGNQAVRHTAHVAWDWREYTEVEAKWEDNIKSYLES